MPSTILSNFPAASGAQIVISGNPWSGYYRPQGGIQFKVDRNASGNVYIGLSGGMTTTSGSQALSGGSNSGMLDGMQLGPGDAYWIPRIAFPVSGTFNVYGTVDAAGSGQIRLYFEVY